ncbi:Uncharacterised protein, partial [Metamycoplasma alkalescens]
MFQNVFWSLEDNLFDNGPVLYPLGKNTSSTGKYPFAVLPFFSSSEPEFNHLLYSSTTPFIATPW